MRHLLRGIARAGLALAVAAILMPAAAAHAAGPYVVNATSDLPDVNPGDGNCATSSANCTLRAAIQEANAGAASPDTINFNITPVGGVKTIALAANLPTITDDLTIDGTTQSGWAANPNSGFTSGGVAATLTVEVDANQNRGFVATKPTTLKGP
jgi:CSLREA domain-containing protein